MNCSRIKVITGLLFCLYAVSAYAATPEFRIEIKDHLFFRLN